MQILNKNECSYKIGLKKKILLLPHKNVDCFVLIANLVLPINNIKRKGS